MMPLISIFIASLLGSPHCVAMCGGFVALYTADKTTGPVFSKHLAYNLGRLISYLILGTVAGIVGHELTHIGAVQGVANLSGIIAGLFLVFFGLTGVLHLSVAQLPQRALVRISHRLVEPAMRKILGKSSLPLLQPLAIGLTTALLPCGFLYAFVTLAVASGTVAGGLVVMFVFWLGTVPILAALGEGLRRTLTPLRSFLPRISSALILLAGMLSLAGHFHLLAGTSDHCEMHNPTANVDHSHHAH